MSMMPHWLDLIFESSKGGKDAARTLLEKSQRLDDALDRATYAYREKERELRDDAEANRPRKTGSPAEAARTAFIESIREN